MTHLYIEQATDRTEEVNSSIISKLYELAISGDLDNTSDLKGRLHTTICKDIHYNYLNNNFDELYISADTLSITFEDPDVESVVVSYLGTDGNVLLSDIQAFITSGRGFGEGWRDPRTHGDRSWTTIYSTRLTWDTFNEFRLFEGVTAINSNAFKDCRQLTSIQLPTTVNTIKNLAFYNCTSLTSIDLSNIQHIGGLVFYGSGITGVINLPNIVSFGDSSGTGSFAQCTNITEVNIGPNFNNDTLYMNTMFSDCTSLTKVTGLSNITSIPDRMFYRDSSLSDVDIDFSKITTLGPNCFARSGLTGIINLPNLTTLGNDVFSECTGITEVNIGANVSNENKIRSLDYTFHLCTSLTKVTGLSQVTEIRNAFKGCTNLEYIDTTSNLTSLTNNTNNCFLDCKKLKCIDVSNVSIIPAHCFRECSSLLSLSTSDPSNTNSNEETFTINDTVIRDSSFTNSYLNNKILYYPNATSMEGWSHYGSSIKGLRAPNVITIGGENSFSNCKSLVSVELGNVTSIAGNTFSNSNNLVDIKFGTSPITYNSQDLCVDIENSSILTVGHHAFANTTSLFTSKTVEYTEEVNGQTQTNSFTGRVKLKLLNCTSIGNGSFENSRVSEVYAPSTTFIDGHSFKGSHIQKITIGNVTAINEFSFSNCTNLTTINFPSTLTSIKLNALSNTSLGVVDLPSSIEEILSQAFSQCSSIPYFILRSTTPPTLGNGFAFPNLFNNGNVVRKIYVPDGSLSAYLTAWANVTLWNDYIVNALDVISNIPLS